MVDGMIFAASGGGLSLLAAPGTKWPDDSTSRLLPLTNPPAPNPKYDDTKRASHLQYFLGQGDPRKYPLLDTGDGYLYYAGLFWHRIDLKKLTVEHLTSTWPTSEYRSAPLGVSAHYGLYTWVQGTLRKITVDESAIPKKGDPIDK